MYKNRDPLLRFIGAIIDFSFIKKEQIKSCLFTSRKEASWMYRAIFITFQMQNSSLIADFAIGQWLHNIFSRNIFFNFPVRKTSKPQNRSHTLIKEQKLLKWTIFLRNTVDFLNAFIQPPPPPFPEAFHHTLLSMFCENWIIELKRI